jgi:hypothetical protein
MADMDKEATLTRSALAVLLERAGGSAEYTQSEYQAVMARRGPYRIVGEIDKSGPGEPRIRVSLVPAPAKPGTRPDA